MAKTIYAANQPPSFMAGWTSRLALFAGVLLVVTVVLHRLFALPTPIALNIAAACFAGAALALVMGLIAGLDVWITGRQGAARIIFGVSVALGLLAIPAAIWSQARQWPEINDVTTDVSDPPPFVAAAKSRSVGANPLTYPSERFAELQAKFYPDVKSLIVPRTPDETFDVVQQALTKLRYEVTGATPPSIEEGAPGLIETYDTTLMLGFVDDVVIRVMEDEAGSSIDLRSASRYGRNDFGRNAERVRLILKEIVARLEATITRPDAAKKPAARLDKKKPVKRQKARDPASAADRRRPDPSQSDARRAQQRKASPQE
ncbi:MAG: DUF1499 domain-containing protein [Hyphomicrobium sp.]